MTSQNNALVEIALALAMAFFSIMVLAMVSMSVSGGHPTAENQANKENVAAINVWHSSPSNKTPSNAKGQTHITPDEVIIYFKGKFYNASLKEVSEAHINRATIKYLAVNPSIPTAEAVNIRKRFLSNALVVTLLNDEWLRILQEKQK